MSILSHFKIVFVKVPFLSQLKQNTEYQPQTFCEYSRLQNLIYKPKKMNIFTFTFEGLNQTEKMNLCKHILILEFVKWPFWSTLLILVRKEIHCDYVLTTVN